MALHPAVNNYFNQMGQAYGFNPHDVNSHGPMLGRMHAALANPALNPQARDSILNHANALQNYGKILRGGPSGIATPAPNGMVTTGGTGALFGGQPTSGMEPPAAAGPSAGFGNVIGSGPSQAPQVFPSLTPQPTTYS